MIDSKVLAAIITSSVAFVIGIINIILNVKKSKRDKMMILRQEHFNKELESLKLKNQKEIIEFQNNIKANDLINEEKIKRKHLTLRDIQAVKDSLYYLIDIMKLDSKRVSNKELDKISESILKYIQTYNLLYMDMNEKEKSMIHKLKNVLHNVLINIEIKLSLKQMKNDNSKQEIIEQVEASLEYIGTIQTGLIQYYNNQK